MRALVVSTDHPDESVILERWVVPLLRDGWDVLYAAPFTDSEVEPRDGLTGLDLPVGRGEHVARRVARSILNHRGPEVDLILVSSEHLAELAPPGAHVMVADRLGHVRSQVAGRAGSSATPPAS